MDFVLRGCAGNDGGEGRYRLLRVDGTEIVTGPMGGWCDPEASRVNELSGSEFDCAGERCVRTFRVALSPSATLVADENEARLHRTAFGTCAGDEGRDDARIDAWGGSE